MDYDEAATAEARSRYDVLMTGTCGECGKSMYKEAPYPGVPNEWRHRSTGQPVSWNPGKHLAGAAAVDPHQHRFEQPQSADRTPRGAVCAIAGCDATRQDAPVSEKLPAPLTGRAAREAVSRRRGVINSKRSIGTGTGF